MSGQQETRWAPDVYVCVLVSSESRAVDGYVYGKNLHGFRKPLKKLKLVKEEKGTQFL